MQNVNTQTQMAVLTPVANTMPMQQLVLEHPNPLSLEFFIIWDRQPSNKIVSDRPGWETWPPAFDVGAVPPTVPLWSKI